MRRIFIFVVVFFLGYFTRGWMDSRGIVLSAPTILPPATKTGVEHSAFITQVRYENGSFKPATVSIKKGNIIIITNGTDSLMWLVSEAPELNTPRGYGKGEQIKTKLVAPGSYKVGNKLRLGAMLTVIVTD